jgi:hypothetical protein
LRKHVFEANKKDFVKAATKENEILLLFFFKISKDK